MDMWGYLDELEKDRSELYTQYTRKLGFSTKGSKTLGRRHLQVKEEAKAFEDAAQAKAREKAEEEEKRAARELEALLKAEQAAATRAALVRSLEHQ